MKTRSIIFTIFVCIANALFPEEKTIIDLYPYLQVDTESAIREVGCHPVFLHISKKEIQEIYDLSDACLANKNSTPEILQVLNTWEWEFSHSSHGTVWQNVRFGIRDKRPSKERKKDQKFYLQFSKEYGDWVMEYKAEELKKYPLLEELFLRLLSIEDRCQKMFLEKTLEFLKYHPQIYKLLYIHNNSLRVPISIRVISYEPEDSLSVSPHFDKAAMTLLLPSDDDPLQECLVVAPANGTPFDPFNLKRPIRPLPTDQDTHCCSLFLTGSMLEYIGVAIPPTPHAVLPHKRPLRHVLVAFCNVPYLDTSHLSYAIAYKKEMPDHFEERFR